MVNVARGLGPRSLVLLAAVAGAGESPTSDPAGASPEGPTGADGSTGYEGAAAEWKWALAAHGAERAGSVAVGFDSGAVRLLQVVAANAIIPGAVFFFGSVAALDSFPHADRTALSGVHLFLGARRVGQAEDRQLVRLARALQESGAAVTLRWRDRGAGVTEAELQAARTWLRLSGFALVA